MADRHRPSVLIVDDHAAFRSFAHLLLDGDGWNVLGEAGDGVEALAAIARRRPDVVLLDIQLPDRSGFEVAEELARDPASPCVVLMSSRERADYGTRVGSAHACGFLCKRELSGAALATSAGSDAAGPHTERR